MLKNLSSILKRYWVNPPPHSPTVRLHYCLIVQVYAAIHPTGRLMLERREVSLLSDCPGLCTHPSCWQTHVRETRGFITVWLFQVYAPIHPAGRLMLERREVSEDTPPLSQRVAPSTTQRMMVSSGTQGYAKITIFHPNRWKPATARLGAQRAHLCTCSPKK